VKNSSKRRAHFNFSTHDVSIVFHKLDAPHLLLVTFFSCALVVSRLTTKLISLANSTDFSAPPFEVLRV